MDFLNWTADDLNMASDAAKSDKLGFGAYCENDGMRGDWLADWIRNEDPSIEFLELFALTAGVLTWIHRFRNRHIWLFCNNESVMYMVNKMSSKCSRCMTLIRMLALEGMRWNVRIYVKHIKSELNILSDALSRGQMRRFWKHAPVTMSQTAYKNPRITVACVQRVERMNNYRTSLRLRQKKRKTSIATSSSGSSRLSTSKMEEILDRLESSSIRKSTRDSYIKIWRSFNKFKFTLRLDRIPKKWEDRALLYLAF